MKVVEFSNYDNSVDYPPINGPTSGNQVRTSTKSPDVPDSIQDKTNSSSSEWEQADCLTLKTTDSLYTIQYNSVAWGQPGPSPFSGIVI